MNVYIHRYLEMDIHVLQYFVYMKRARNFAKNPLHLPSTRTSVLLLFPMCSSLLERATRKECRLGGARMAWYLQQDMHTRYKHIEFSFKGYLKKKTIQTAFSQII